MGNVLVPEVMLQRAGVVPGGPMTSSNVRKLVTRAGQVRSRTNKYGEPAALEVMRSKSKVARG